jgi:hypothetical protein
MQPELPAIDFATQAEARSKAEGRRTEELTGLLRMVFERWAARFRQSEHPIFGAVSRSPGPITAGK